VDTLPNTPRTALALGVQGLAPYWFEVEASAYVEPSGRTHVRVETEYDLLITNRLVLQPLVEFEVYGRADRERLIGTGLSTGELGVRLRYEFRREFAPYLGVVWSRRFFGTADLARAAGEEVAGTRLAVGLRTWF
jgi:copper resistance protein B